MYCIAERVVLPPLKEEERKELLEKAARLRVYETLEAVPDPGGRHGLRYEWAFLLTCLLAALLCHCTSTEAIAPWCREQVALLREVFGMGLFLTPRGSLSLSQVVASPRCPGGRGSAWGLDSSSLTRGSRRADCIGWQGRARGEIGRTACPASALVLDT